MTKYCPSCGEQLVDNARFCKSCGLNLENIEQNTNAGQQASQNHTIPVVENDHKFAIIAGYILAVLIPLFGIIIGIYLYTRKDSQKAQSNYKYILLLAIGRWLITSIFFR